MTLSKRFATTLRETSLRRWATGAGALVLAVSGAFGGLKAVQAEPGPSVAVKTAVEGGAWRVTVKSVQVQPELPPILLHDKKNHFIVVVATLEVTAEHTWVAFDDTLRLHDVDGILDKRPQIALIKDGKRLFSMQPGMPEDVAFFWEQSATAKVPKQLTVWVMGETYRKSSLDGSRAGRQWLYDGDDAPRARISAPVDDRRNRAAPSASPSATPTPRKS